VLAFFRSRRRIESTAPATGAATEAPA
jgi:hypothetical protein